MFETLTVDIVLSLAIFGVSALGMCATLVALRATQHKEVRVDVDALVEAAPYHRLHNILPSKDA